MTVVAQRAFVIDWKNLGRWVLPKTLLLARHLPKGWSLARVGGIVRQVSERVRVEAAKEYKMIGVKWYGEGTFHRETVRGNSLSATWVTPVIPNAFIYNRLFAWKGSFAVVPQEHGGHFVSNEFPQFIVDEKRVLSSYLYLFFMCDGTIRAVNASSIGSAAVSRNRLKEDEFLSFDIPLPPPSTQRVIVRRWEKAQEEIAGARQTIEQLNLDIDRQFMNEIGIKLKIFDNSRKVLAVWWKQLARWDVVFAKNLGGDFRSNLYPNVTIADVIQPLRQTTKRTDPRVTPKAHFNYIGLANVESQTGRLVGFSSKLGEDIESSCVVYDQEHILYSKLRPYLRKAIVPSEFGLAEGVASSEFLPIKPAKPVLRDFLTHYLCSSAVELQAKQAVGARMPRISPDALLKFSIPLPPLKVQHEIIEKIQETRGRIAKEREKARQVEIASKQQVEEMILGTRPAPLLSGAKTRLP